MHPARSHIGRCSLLQNGDSAGFNLLLTVWHWVNFASLTRLNAAVYGASSENRTRVFCMASRCISLYTIPALFVRARICTWHSLSRSCPFIRRGHRPYVVSVYLCAMSTVPFASRHVHVCAHTAGRELYQDFDPISTFLSIPPPHIILLVVPAGPYASDLRQL